jgi:hypothetical protein
LNPDLVIIDDKWMVRDVSRFLIQPSIECRFVASCGHGNEIHKESGGGGAGAALNVRIEEFELAFAEFEGEAAGVGERPTEWALKPFGAVALDAIRDFCDADDAAGFKGVRQIGDAVAAFDVGERFGRGVGFALAGVNQDGAAQIGCPNPIFNILVTIDDEPCPRLADGNRF